MFKISQTDDYESLVELFMRNELEFSEEEPVPTDLVKCWKAESDEGTLIGGLALAKREGEFIIDGVAIDPEYRALKAGKSLLDEAIDEVRRLGGKSIFLVARAPEFFRKQFFVTVSREDAPNFFECLTCPQYGISCHPEVMKLIL